MCACDISSHYMYYGLAVLLASCWFSSPIFCTMGLNYSRPTGFRNAKNLLFNNGFVKPSAVCWSVGIYQSSTDLSSIFSRWECHWISISLLWHVPKVFCKCHSVSIVTMDDNRVYCGVYREIFNWTWGIELL